MTSNQALLCLAAFHYSLVSHKSPWKHGKKTWVYTYETSYCIKKRRQHTACSYPAVGLTMSRHHTSSSVIAASPARRSSINILVQQSNFWDTQHPNFNYFSDNEKENRLKQAFIKDNICVSLAITCRVTMPKTYPLEEFRQLYQNKVYIEHLSKRNTTTKTVHNMNICLKTK